MCDVTLSARGRPPKTAWDVRLLFTHPPLRIEAFCRPDAGSGAENAEFRDRSAPDVCPIAILRGLLL